MSNQQSQTQSPQYEQNADKQANSEQPGFYINTWGIGWRILAFMMLGVMALLHMAYVEHLVEAGVFDAETQQSVGFIFSAVTMAAFMIFGGEVTNALRRWFVGKTGKSRLLYGGLAVITGVGFYVLGTPAPGTGDYAEALDSLWWATCVIIASGWIDGAIYPEDKTEVREKLRGVLD